MGKIRVRVKAPFGEIVVEGESAQEILKTLKTMPPQFVNEIGSLISSNLTPSLKTQLDGIIETHNRRTNYNHPRKNHPLRSHRPNSICF